MRCRVCDNNAGNETVECREMTLGLRDRFTYFLCAGCGCLQIAEIPEDLSRYYPPDYYSYQSPGKLFNNPVKAAIKKARARAVFERSSLMGRLIARWYAPPDYFHWLQTAGVRLDHKILDVGCGTGDLLVSMRREGFLHLTGIDPFLARTIRYDNGVSVHKMLLSAADGIYDLIMLHHSFEHMPDPAAAFGHLARCLRPGGVVLLRIPLRDSLAWERYRENWVQIDAPRHLFLHTVKSIAQLSQRHGFTIRDIEYDSNAFQFWGSEQLKMDISLSDARSWSRSQNAGLFTADQMDAFNREADALNRSGRGDQACFYLTR